jgi:hypothetical protein
MTQDEARQLCRIPGTDLSLHDSDKNRLFGSEHYKSDRPVYNPNPWPDGDFGGKMATLLVWANVLNQSVPKFAEARRLLEEEESVIGRVIRRSKQQLKADPAGKRRHARSGHRMKRAFRLAWIFAANGSVICFSLARLWPAFTSRSATNPEVLLELLLEVLFPVIGIEVELVRWRFAKWVNVGYLVAGGCLWLGEGVYWHSNAFFGVFLIVSLGMFTLASITEIVYRRTA